MEEILGFGVIVIVISVSGVMSPGPLFAANIMYGLKDGVRAGIKMAHGHAIVEFPLILLLGVGVISLESFPQFRVIITIMGAIGLFAFAGLQVRGIVRDRNNHRNDVEYSGVMMSKTKRDSPFLVGVLFSALNPFFIVWWITIGSKLILDATSFGPIMGIVILFGFHIWMDYVWLGLVAFLSKKSTRLLSSNMYRILIILLSGVLIYFGTSFVLDVLATV
jgi:threonine/homoserine/homoserine lactone efflux protein